jgi:hypothetical protein
VPLSSAIATQRIEVTLVSRAAIAVRDSPRHSDRTHSGGRSAALLFLRGTATVSVTFTTD